MDLFLDIWRSWRRMPLWVQVWVAGLLVPVNLASLAFLAQPQGWLIALLAVGGMAPNVVIMTRERGLSKAMALPHVAIWTPLVVTILWLQSTGPASGFAVFLWLLLAVDLISLGFDCVDSWKWFRGERAIA